ncbi:hypothetical protein [Streptomyces nanshensis]|uniref:Uncharacterized protein n=1 Tax=Streptomyces nanshensis TaxID=518642 RepID=A0A1E7LCX4_9ACTN|nr:hypothetical protein [Streptomyces nanshensis]OEV14057.1 hypothetical protein AN218_00850 [Streptomyces nanshensis]
MKEKIHYVATTPDGAIPDSVAAGTPVNLADHVGETIEHPNPGREWYDESEFSYFRTYTSIGEVLERIDDWPVRLWIVEPVGETGNWSPRHYPYWVLAHKVRVAEEIEPWRALGPRGNKVLDFIDRQLPTKARQWISRWQADPQGMQQRFTDWYEDPTEERNSLEMALRHVAERARTSRREAARDVARNLAARAAAQALSDTGVNDGPYEAYRGRDTFLESVMRFRRDQSDSERLTDYVTARATSLAAAIQFQDRLELRELQALRAPDLESAAA